MTGHDDSNHETHVTAIAYGGCCEPGGLELTDESWTGACPNPKCGKDAKYFRWERAEGSLNVYTGYVCDHCGARRCYPWWPEGMGDEYEPLAWDDEEEAEEEGPLPGRVAGLIIRIREDARDLISAMRAARRAFLNDWQGSRYHRQLAEEHYDRKKSP